MVGRRTNTVIEENGKPSTEVTVKGHQWDENELRSLDSYEAALALVQQTIGAEVVSADDEIGNGFEVLDSDDKYKLVGVSLILMSWDFHVGDMGPFVSVMAVAQMNGGGAWKVIINDGSTGIYKQLDSLHSRNGRTGGLLVKKGLRRSDYTYTDADGKEAPATTYYLDTSA